MVKRIKVGLIYTNNENWIGGTYYIQNLVYALNSLKDEEKPELVIYTYTENDFLTLKETNYPYILRNQLVYSPGKLSFFKKVINKINFYIFDKYLYAQPILMSNLDVDIVFPADIGLIVSKSIKKLYWIPDFQEQKLPNFFTKEQIFARNQSHHLISKSPDPVIFSSEDAFNDFKKIEPKYSCKPYVLNFAVTHPNYKNLDISKLFEKYNIDKPYFFAPNQFWKHKNQMVVLNAINFLKAYGVNDFIVAFSGKEFDGENAGYFISLKKYVEDNNISDQVRFLGFIDRKEQLKLMENAIAIIQPSLFEGWSTVVEDAKAMNQYVIASNLNVHIEQLKNNVRFFNPNDALELSDILKSNLIKKNIVVKYDYEDNIFKFSEDFMKILKQIL